MATDFSKYKRYYGDALGYERLPRKTSKRPPNILIINSDEHNAGYAGFSGHPVVRTPNLDRLARTGVVFENTYCPYPLCSPSRQSFMSGLYCHEIGVWDNSCAMPEDTVTWAHILSLAGYETTLVGKMHFNGYQKYYGFDQRPIGEGSSGEEFFSYGIRVSHDWTKPLPYSSDDYRSGGGKSDWDAIMEAGADKPERMPATRRDYEVLEKTLKILKEKKKEPAGQPWAICASINLPHPPWKARKDILETYKGKADLPVNTKGLGLDTCDKYIQRYNGNLVDLPKEAILRCRETYFAMITEMDEITGKLIDVVKDDPNTVVIYVSDHGEMAGEHGLWFKVVMLESSVKVPLVISWPGHYPSGKRVAQPASLIDLFPTLVDIAGVELPPHLPLSGSSLLPALEGKGKWERKDKFGKGLVFGECNGEGWNHPRAFIRDKRFKLVYNHTAECRLYDLAKDPDELKDLYAKPGYKGPSQRLKKALLAQWNPEKIEKKVYISQARRQIARNKFTAWDGNMRKE